MLICIDTSSIGIYSADSNEIAATNILGRHLLIFLEKGARGYDSGFNVRFHSVPVVQLRLLLQVTHLSAACINMTSQGSMIKYES